MSEPALEAAEVETGPRPQHAVVWLHGLGADGHDFEPLVGILDLGGLPVRFVFPHAPQRPVSLNGGFVMRAWYDILGLDRGAEQDEAGLRAAAGQIETLIRGEAERGVPPQRLVLAGFSQGAALALHTGLRQAQPLAGLIVLSGYLPLTERLAEEAHPASRDVPIFMAHGRADEVLPMELGEASRERLQAGGHPVEWHTYAMGHGLCEPEVDDLSRWLRRVLV